MTFIECYYAYIMHLLVEIPNNDYKCSITRAAIYIIIWITDKYVRAHMHTYYVLP